MSRSFLLPILLISLLLSACSSDEEAAEGELRRPAVENPENFTVVGSVSMGIAAGAHVRLFPIVDSGIDTQREVASAVTDPAGEFSLDVASKYSREPMLIEVSGADANVYCVSLDGCAPGVEFTSLLPQPSSTFILRLVVPSLSAATDYQVSLLSEMASAAALARIKGTDQDSANGVGNVEVQYLAATANSQLASLFGLVEDLTLSKVANIIEVDQENGVDSAALYHASLESSLISSCLAPLSPASLSAAIGYCSAQYIQRGVPSYSSEPGADVSMLQVIDGVRSVYDLLQLAGLDMSIEKSRLSAQRGVLLTQEPEQYSKGTASENVHLPLMVKGKQFVENIRQIASSLNLTRLVALGDLAKFVSGETAVTLEDVGVRVDIDDALVGEQLQNTLKVFQASLGAVFDVIFNHYTDGEPPLYVEMAEVFHEFSEDDHRIRIVGPIAVCEDDISRCEAQVDLTFDVQLQRFSLNGVTESLNANLLEISASGAVEFERYKFELPQTGANLTFTKPFLDVASQDEKLESLTFEFASGKAEIPFAVVRNNGMETISIDGRFQFTSGFANLTYATDEVVSEEGAVEEQVSFGLTDLEEFDANLSGAIRTSEGANFYAAINILQSPKPFAGAVAYTQFTTMECGQAPECELLSSRYELSGESEESFLGLTASTSYRADLQGIREPVDLQISATRKSPSETAINSLKVTYPGHALRLNGQFNNNGGITSMNATNLDGMEMFIETGEGGKRYGAVTGPGGEHVADVIDMGQWVKIPYPDGHFVSM